MLVGTGSLALIVGLRRLAPGVPGSLAAVAVGITAVKAFGLDVPTVGEIGSGLPSFGLPDIGLGDAGGLAAGGVGVMLIAFAEGLGAAKAFSAADDEQIDADRERIANVVDPLAPVVPGLQATFSREASATGRATPPPTKQRPASGRSLLERDHRRACGRLWNGGRHGPPWGTGRRAPCVRQRRLRVPLGRAPCRARGCRR